ncbi:hypothetical protein [Cognataquiflexum rubidum]|uniref:hypothetical protein n=1 Tax=Cognataquiflexum rubidum TaxID=2922273 RepID=UPI001F14357B|nr:hypothetical protein [Cognataquiflexum rubidum]MCH6234197.1 hypothetical protein [Cognataquiflexum rubidum]
MKTLLFFCYLLAPVSTFDFGDTMSEMVQPEIQLKEPSADFWNTLLANHSPDSLNLFRSVDFQEDYPFDSRLAGSYYTTDYYNSSGLSKPKCVKLNIDSLGNVILYEPENFDVGSSMEVISDTSSKILAEFKIYTRVGNIYIDHYQTQKKEFICKYSVEENSMVWMDENGEMITWRR